MSRSALHRCLQRHGVSRLPALEGQVAVKRYHHDSHNQLRQHLQLFINAYNHRRRLKTLRGLTP